MPWCATCEGFHAVTRVACALTSRADLLARAESAEAEDARLSAALLDMASERDVALADLAEMQASYAKLAAHHTAVSDEVARLRAEVASAWESRRVSTECNNETQAEVRRLREQVREGQRIVEALLDRLEPGIPGVDSGLDQLTYDATMWQAFPDAFSPGSRPTSGKP